MQVIHYLIYTPSASMGRDLKKMCTPSTLAGEHVQYVSFGLRHAMFLSAGRGLPQLTQLRLVACCGWLEKRRFGTV